MMILKTLQLCFYCGLVVKELDMSSLSTHPVFLPLVCSEVINGDLHTLALLQLPQGGDQQLEVKRPGMVKVVVVARRQSLLFWGQNLENKTCLSKPDGLDNFMLINNKNNWFFSDLVKRIHGQQHDPRHIQRLDYLIGNCGLP